MVEIIDTICMMNGIDVRKDFVARWVYEMDDEGETVYDNISGGDIACCGWQDLAKHISEEYGVPPNHTIEFQTYQVDGEGECIDSTIIDWEIDWVGGFARLKAIALCG